MNPQLINPQQQAAKAIDLYNPNDVKPLFNGVGTIISAAVTIDSDGNGTVSQGEWFTFANVVISRVVSNFSTFNVSLNTLRNPTPAVRQAIIESFSEGFNLPNKEVEGLVEDWLIWVNQGVRLGERTSEYFRQKRAAKAA